MPFLLLIMGAVLLVATLRNTQGQLGEALATDVPPFLKIALAIGAVGSIGFLPKMQPIGRMLLALVMVVLALKNYADLFKGFTSLSAEAPAPTKAAVTPAAAYVADPNNPQVSQEQISGGGSSGTALAATTTAPFGAYDPAAFLSGFQSGIGGFGGIA